MSYPSLLPNWRDRQPDENYHVGVPGAWEESVGLVIESLLRIAQSANSPFRPDDLADELQQARRFLARSPRASPPAFEINFESETSMFEPTHVLPGRIVHVWYRIWEEDQIVWLSLDPNQAQGRLV